MRRAPGRLPLLRRLLLVPLVLGTVLCVSGPSVAGLDDAAASGPVTAALPATVADGPVEPVARRPAVGIVPRVTASPERSAATATTAARPAATSSSRAPAASSASSASACVRKPFLIALSASSSIRPLSLPPVSPPHDLGALILLSTALAIRSLIVPGA